MRELVTMSLRCQPGAPEAQAREFEALRETTAATQSIEEVAQAHARAWEQRARLWSGR